MASKYQEFDRARLKILPLSQRVHDLTRSAILPLQPVSTTGKPFSEVADNIVKAKKNGKAVVLMMGAHVLRAGVQKYLIDLLEKEYISCIAMNGAGVIHDFEFSLIGATTESVAKYIRDGRFGLWQETGQLNNIISGAANKQLGLGEAVGKVIAEGVFPYKDNSLLATAYKVGVPVTVHVGIGYDIIHELPNCDGAALGEVSYRDFLIFARVLENLTEGVVMTFGSAVMAPEVFLKALSMARNVASQKGEEINNFYSLVCDLVDLPDNCQDEPCRKDPRYYFRPWKTLLSRTVAGEGESLYFSGNHSQTIPLLWTCLTQGR